MEMRRNVRLGLTKGSVGEGVVCSVGLREESVVKDQNRKGSVR